MKLTPHTFILADGRSPDSPQMLALARQIAAPYHLVAAKQLQMTADAMVAASLGTYKTVRAYGDVRILTQITPGVSRVIIDVAMRKILAEQAQAVSEHEVLPYLWIGVRIRGADAEGSFGGHYDGNYTTPHFCLYEPGAGTDPSAQIISNRGELYFTPEESVNSPIGLLPGISSWGASFNAPKIYYGDRGFITTNSTREYLNSDYNDAEKLCDMPYDPKRPTLDAYYNAVFTIDPFEEYWAASQYYPDGYLFDTWSPDDDPMTGGGTVISPVEPSDHRGVVPTADMFPAGTGRGTSKCRSGLYTLKVCVGYSDGVDLEILVRSGKNRRGGVLTEKTFTGRIEAVDLGDYIDGDTVRHLIPGGYNGADCAHGPWWWQGAVLCSATGVAREEAAYTPWGFGGEGLLRAPAISYYGAIGVTGAPAGTGSTLAARAFFYTHHMDATEQAAVYDAFVAEAAYTIWTVSTWASYPQLAAVEAQITAYLGGDAVGRTAIYEAASPYLGSHAAPSITMRGSETFDPSRFTGPAGTFDGHTLTHRVWVAL